MVCQAGAGWVLNIYCLDGCQAGAGLIFFASKLLEPQEEEVWRCSAWNAWETNATHCYVVALLLLRRRVRSPKGIGTWRCPGLKCLVQTCNQGNNSLCRCDSLLLCLAAWRPFGEWDIEGPDLETSHESLKNRDAMFAVPMIRLWCRG
eukprot:1159097-Pelagomonas_calceolata.AAC.7